MADIKATSFRVNEEDIAKFKEFADKEGYNQAEAFKSIMQSFEMANAKGMIKDRAKEIETFQDTVNRLMGYYLNSLEVNQSSEERIREELSQEINLKDDTISTMLEQLQEEKANNKILENNNKDTESKNKELNELLQKANTDSIDKQKTIDKLNSNNDLLQEQLQEYKQYKEQYKALEEQLEKVKGSNEKLELNKTLLETTIAKLKDKINNDNEMLEFYKSNNAELKDNIKTLEQQNKQEVSNIKEEHTKALNERIASHTEQLQSKHDVELAKKDLEINKLKNEIEQLKAKPHRTTTSKTK